MQLDKLDYLVIKWYQYRMMRRLEYGIFEKVYLFILYIHIRVQLGAAQFLNLEITLRLEVRIKKLLYGTVDSKESVMKK